MDLQTIADYAALRQSVTVVSLYDNLTAKEALSTISQTRSAAVVLSADKVLPFIKACVLAAEKSDTATATASTNSTNGAEADEPADPKSPSLASEAFGGANSTDGRDGFADMLSSGPKLIVLDFETLPKNVVLKCKLLGVELHAFEDIERLGKGKGRASDPPASAPETVAAIVFSSGTSGTWRG